jgi:hypothetical protein
MAEKSNGACEDGLRKPFERLPDKAVGAIKKLESLPQQPLEQGKVSVGLAVKHAIGDDPMKVYGPEGQLSRVIAGKEVPDYMGRIASRPDALRRYALSLLRNDPKVRIRTTVDWEEEAM